MTLRGEAAVKDELWVKLASLVLLALFVSQPVEAASYPVTITYGRSWPLSVVADSSRGLVYVDGTSGDYPPTGFTFGVINATTHQITKILPLDEIPGPIALDQSNGDVYVAGNYSIAVFDGATQNFSRLIEVGHPILNMIYDGNVSKDIFVAAGDEVYAFDPQTGAMVANATVKGGPQGMVVVPSNGMLYVSEYTMPEIAVFQASNLETAGTIALPTCCVSWLALNPKTQAIYGSTGTNYVDEINAGTNSFEKSLKVAQSSQNSTNAITVDDVTNRVYVASSPGGSVLELDGSTGAVVRTFLVGSDSQVAGLAFDTKTEELYATNYHLISVYSAARTRTFLLVLIIAVAAVVAAALLVYVFLRRRDERERARVQSGWAGHSQPEREAGSWTS
jgi:DNA-binding beta-propeller fold protein YncE